MCERYIFLKTSSVQDQLAQSVSVTLKIYNTTYKNITIFWHPVFGSFHFCLIEERESTIVVGEDATVSVDKYGFMWIKLD